MRNSLPIKTLIILDKDNCELDTLEVFGALEETLAQIARNRQLPEELLHDLTRAAEGEHRFNDVPGLIDYMNEVEPRFKTNNQDHIQSDISAKHDWIKETSRLSSFYPGVLKTLQLWHDNGTNVVTKTDCERLPLIRRIWLTAINAYRERELERTPWDIIPLYDHIYCKPSLGEPESDEAFNDYLLNFCKNNAVPFAFATELNRHITVFRDGHKPSQSHMKQILSDFPTKREHILYIGDNYKDGLEAQTIDPPVDFAWAKYGASWKPKVRDFYSKVGSKSYQYGVSEIAAMLEAHSVNIRLILENSLADVIDHFDFQSGWNLPRRTLEESRKAEQMAARNPAEYRVASLDLPK